jgi:hypothetical protein
MKNTTETGTLRLSAIKFQMENETNIIYHYDKSVTSNQWQVLGNFMTTM